MTEKNVNKEKLKAFFSLFVDDMSIVTTGKFADNVERKEPEVRKLLRTRSKDMHSALSAKVEGPYLEEHREKWPRSQVKMAKWQESLMTYSRDLKRISRKGKQTWEEHLDRLQEHGIDNPYVQSKVFKLDTTGVELSTSSGLPALSSKREELQNGIAYWEKIERDDTQETWPTVAGLKTETAPEGVTKPRTFLIHAMCEWIGQLKYLRDGIKSTVERGKRMKNSTLYYMDFDELHRFFKGIMDLGDSIVVLDAKQFGAHLTEQELDNCVRWDTSYTDGVGVEHMIEYFLHAAILYYDGYIEERGSGLGDGAITTNKTNSMVMDWETWDAFEAIKLDSRIEGSWGNGDDKLYVLSTIVTEETIEKMAKHTDRQFVPEKTWIDRDSAYFCKVFWCADYYTASLVLTLNRLKFLRRVKIHNEVEFKAYVAVRVAMIMEYIRYHPLASEFRNIIRSCDKYPIDELDDSIVDPAKQQYAKENVWLQDLGLEEKLAGISEQSFYVTG